ncbi:hypothetical protein GCM10009415_53940 [Chitinophaga japonensis]
MEIAYGRLLHGRLTAWWEVWLTGIVKDISFLLTAAAWAYPAYYFISLGSGRLARRLFTTGAAILCGVHLVLSEYFLTTLTMLGADLWIYSSRDIWQTISAAGIKWPIIPAILLTVTVASWCLVKLPPRLRTGPLTGIGLVALFIICEAAGLAAITHTWRSDSSEYGNSLSNNKSWFFYKQSIDYFFPAPADTDLYTDSHMADYINDPATWSTAAFQYPDEERYPFLHLDETPDVLSPFLRKGSSPPNIVLVIVEGLGSAYSGRSAYLGSFTPFLDSLSRHSLYWENFLSQSGRTFAALPVLLASLPFGKTGFTELDSRMPPHLSMLSLLKRQGYHTAFYYGGDATFDNMTGFLERNAIDEILDITAFPGEYRKLPAGNQGLCWGYGDKELFHFYFSTLPATGPYCHVLLTVASHEPFLVHNQESYLARVEQRISAPGFAAARRAAARNFKKQYASILYVDDALQYFFHTYAQRPDFHNTIFIITGDHRMPEIPMRDKLDRYHVPLIIYAPLLLRSARFSAISTHFDVAPSMLQLLKNQYGLQIPSLAAWVGSGLDTGYTFTNRHAYPLMQNKHYMIDFIQGDHMMIGNDLYRIQPGMSLEPVQDKHKLAQLRRGFERFRKKNRQMLDGASLLPDSIYQRYYPR